MDEKKMGAGTPEKVSLVIPISIIIAGILVAGAILLNGAKSASAPKNPSDAAAQLTKGTIAEEIGLDKNKFQSCLSNGDTKNRVDADSQAGAKAGIQGTPYSVIMTKDGSEEIINGAQPLDIVKQMVDDVLAGNIKPDKSAKVLPVTKDDHILGNPDATIKIIEYSDTECPFCQRFHSTMQEIMNEYGKDGKVAWVYRYFPLDSLHSRARHEAEAVECAFTLGGSDAFWKYLNLIEKITPTNNGLDPALL